MKILYGVQGTGNGHISRARMMARQFAELDKPELEVSYLFSGRDKDKLFDMECFGDYHHRRGLSFVTKAGKINHLKTLASNNLATFIKDISLLDIEPYDLIITDFEPVTAWAGKLRNKTVIGMGHQYAFCHNIPRVSSTLVSNAIMRYFSPADITMGLHWHHFGSNILPPIIDPKVASQDKNGTVLVYLPFEDQDHVTSLLNTFTDFHFVQYSSDIVDGEYSNVSRRISCHDGFKQDLASASAVFCNAGFELVSECLALRIPVLAKPVKGQFEQESNAKALRKLGYASTIDSLNPEYILQWLSNDKVAVPIQYPNVAEAIVKTVTSRQFDNPEKIQNLCQQLWTNPLAV